MRRAVPLLALVVALAAPGAAGAATRGDPRLAATLAREMRAAGGSSGAYARDVTAGRTLFSLRADSSRILMSNSKLFTTGAALERFGPEGRFETTVFGEAAPDADGVLAGDLFVRGGGDPTLGDAAFVAQQFGGQGATIEQLAAAVQAAGGRRVTGGVVGDESLFDTDRGPPLWFFNDSPPGPASGLLVNRGKVRDGVGLDAFQQDPAAFAAAHIRNALIAAGIAVDGPARSGATPSAATRLAAVASPPVSALVRLTNKPSDNLLAEMLAKQLSARATGLGVRSRGAKLAAAFGRRFGARVHLRTGSGALPSGRGTPRALVTFLDRVRSASFFAALFDSLPIAGRDGTLAERMRGTAAQDACRAKTGTNFDRPGRENSALSGYCRTRRGHLVIFSILMNRITVAPARAAQDRMTAAIAGYRG